MAEIGKHIDKYHINGSIKETMYQAALCALI